MRYILAEIPHSMWASTVHMSCMCRMLCVLCNYVCCVCVCVVCVSCMPMLSYATLCYELLCHVMLGTALLCYVLACMCICLHSCVFLSRMCAHVYIPRPRPHAVHRSRKGSLRKMAARFLRGTAGSLVSLGWSKWATRRLG